MQNKKDDTESIKNLYFEHGCSLFSYVYDGPEFPDKKRIIKIIKENQVQWSHEFQEIQKKRCYL